MFLSRVCDHNPFPFWRASHMMWYMFLHRACGGCWNEWRNRIRKCSQQQQNKWILQTSMDAKLSSHKVSFPKQISFVHYSHIKMYYKGSCWAADWKNSCGRSSLRSELVVQMGFQMVVFVNGKDLVVWVVWLETLVFVLFLTVCWRDEKLNWKEMS